MRMRVLLLSALCIVLVVGLVFANRESTGQKSPWPNAAKAVTNYRLDNSTCGSWTQARANASQSDKQALISYGQRTWVWGYVTGADTYGKDSLSGTETAALDTWIDNYPRFRKPIPAWPDVRFCLGPRTGF